MYMQIKDKGVAAPIEVLIAIGVLSKKDYERWRFGKVDYLERICKINLHKLSFVNHEIHAYARKHDLRPSWTFYKKWGSRGGAGVVKHEGGSIATNQHGVSAKQTVEKTYISEGNLYHLIIRSKLPAAVRFEAFVCDEILPSIRQHGAYISAETLEQMRGNSEFTEELLDRLSASGLPPMDISGVMILNCRGSDWIW